MPIWRRVCEYKWECERAGEMGEAYVYIHILMGEAYCARCRMQKKPLPSWLCDRRRCRRRRCHRRVRLWRRHR